MAEPDDDRLPGDPARRHRRAPRVAARDLAQRPAVFGVTTDGADVAYHQMWPGGGELEHVAFASCAGPTGDGFGRTAGESAIWAPHGTAMARAGVEVARARTTLEPSTGS